MKELEEELDIKINENDSNLALLPGNPMKPSIGGCDEQIRLWLYKCTITKEKFQDMTSKSHGNKSEGEDITLVFYPIEDFDKVLDKIGDSKAESAWRRYKNL